jgi:predicted SprT family Zn-dependent metalloprotease
VDHHDINAALQLAYEGWGCPQLMDQTKIEWNHRFLRRAADAEYKRFSKQGIIRFSTKVFPIMPYQEQFNTVVHEAAHIAEAYLFGFMSDHGERWKKLMVDLGFEPTICHTMNTRILRSWYVYDCRCGRRWTLTKHRVSRILNSTSAYQCSSCKKMLPVNASVYKEMNEQEKLQRFA